jgi:hypothetical protein
MRSPIGKTLRFRVLERCGFKCAYCGNSASEKALEIDHVFPVSRGGTNAEPNLVAACFDCNRGKRARVLSSEFFGWLALQEDRRDIIGDLASDHARQPLGGPVRSYTDLARSLRAVTRDREVRLAGALAWRDFRKEQL